MPEISKHEGGSELARLSANARKVTAVVRRIEALPVDTDTSQLARIAVALEQTRNRHAS